MLTVLAVPANLFPRQSGLWLPETTDNQRWIGIVCAAGDKVKGFTFGMIVELSRWGSDPQEGNETVWWNAPMPDLWGVHGRDETLYFEEGNTRIEITADYRLAIVDPEHVLFELWEGMVFATPGRLIVRHVERKNETESGLAFDEWDAPMTQVAEIFDACRGFGREHPGANFVLVPPRTGTHFRYGDAWHSSIRERDVVAVSDVAFEGEYL